MISRKEIWTIQAQLAEVEHHPIKSAGAGSAFLAMEYLLDASTKRKGSPERKRLVRTAGFWIDIGEEYRESQAA